MDYIAFLVVNAILFLRPAEIVPELDRLPLYYFAMLACLGFGVVHLINLFFYSPLIRHPTAVLAILLLVFAAISLVVNHDLGRAFDEEFEFAKVITYFILFLAIVRTPQRLQGVFACVVICMSVTALLGVLHFHEAIEIPNLKQMEENVEKRAFAEGETIRRLRFTGIMDGPNEVAVFLSILTWLCAFQLTNKNQGLARHLWLAPIGLFLFSIILTRSRGGLLALLAGFVALVVYSYRPRNLAAASALRGKSSLRGMLLAAIAIPALLVAVGGRQTEISTSAGTARTRFGAWSDWLVKFRYNPIFGVGPKVAPRAADQKGPSWEDELLAHNSYLQPFADFGFFGGLCFLGTLGFGALTMHRYGFNKTLILNPELARLQPYIMAALASCAAGFLTLSINYIIPVFFVLAIPVAYYGMTPCLPPIKRPALTSASVGGLALAGIGFLAMTYALVLVMPKY